MNLLLHIGPHKTGTTAIQTFMRSNDELLAQHGIAYPKVPSDEYNHHAVVHGLRSPGLKDELLAWMLDVLALADRRGCCTCVLSSEMFVEGGIDIAGLVRSLSGVDIRVVAYIRRPDEMWASAFSQLVVEPTVRRTERIDRSPLPYDCGYSTVFCKWMDHFGPDRMQLAPFDRRQWPGGNLLRDFLSMIGAPPDLFEHCSTDAVAYRRSLPAILTAAIRHANACGRVSDGGHARLVRAMDQLAPKLPRFMSHPARLHSRRARRRCIEMLEPWMDRYRPYFRPGFDESFLASTDYRGLAHHADERRA
jgi:hypothetical protein